MLRQFRELNFSKMLDRLNPSKKPKIKPAEVKRIINDSPEAKGDSKSHIEATARLEFQVDSTPHIETIEQPESKGDSKSSIEQSEGLLVSKAATQIEVDSILELPNVIIKLITSYWLLLEDYLPIILWGQQTSPQLISTLWGKEALDPQFTLKYLADLLKKSKHTSSNLCYALNNLTVEERQNLFSDWKKIINTSSPDTAIVYTLLYCFYNDAKNWDPSIASRPCWVGTSLHSTIYFKSEPTPKNLNRLGAYHDFSHLTIPSETKLNKRVANYCNFFNARVVENDLGLSTFKYSDLRGADLSRSDLWGTDFRYSKMDNRVKAQIVEYILNLRYSRDPSLPFYMRFNNEISLPLVNYLQKKLAQLKILATDDITEQWISDNESLVQEIIHLLPLIGARASKARIEGQWKEILEIFKPLPEGLSTAYKRFKMSLDQSREQGFSPEVPRPCVTV